MGTKNFIKETSFVSMNLHGLDCICIFGYYNLYIELRLLSYYLRKWRGRSLRDSAEPPAEPPAESWRNPFFLSSRSRSGQLT
jgi:hypothetical protein